MFLGLLAVGSQRAAIWHIFIENPHEDCEVSFTSP